MDEDRRRLDPGEEEFEAAKDAAGGLVAFVLSVLPAEVHPGTEASLPPGTP
jgi:hypothetical protein